MDIKIDMKDPESVAAGQTVLNEAVAAMVAHNESELQAARARRLAQALLAAASTSPDGRIDEDVARQIAADHGFTDQDRLAELITRGKKTGTIRRNEAEIEAEIADRAAAVQAAQTAVRRAVGNAKATAGAPFPLKHATVYVVRPIELERQTAQGLILPGRDKDGRAALGLVLATPDRGVYIDAGYPEVGDVVVYSRYGGQEGIMPEGPVLFLKPAEIYGVYTGAL